jgi:hypothetical protein
MQGGLAGSNRKQWIMQVFCRVMAGTMGRVVCIKCVKERRDTGPGEMPPMKETKNERSSAGAAGLAKRSARK